jgi:hypothetical protein
MVGNSFNFKAYKVVGDEDAPEFLDDTRWTLASQGLLAFEHLGLDLVVGKLHFPTFMIKLDDLWSGKGDRVEH